MPRVVRYLLILLSIRRLYLIEIALCLRIISLIALEALKKGLVGLRKLKARHARRTTHIFVSTLFRSYIEFIIWLLLPLGLFN